MAGGGVKIDVRVADTLRLEVPTQSGTEVVTLTVEHKSGQFARLRVNAPASVRVQHSRRREPVAG